MKLKKLAMLLSIGLVAASTAYAAEPLKDAKSSAPTATIHDLYVHNTGPNYVVGTGAVFVGHLHDGVCYSGAHSAPKKFTFSPNSTLDLFLDGSDLASVFPVSMGFDCGFIVIDTDTQTIRESAFILYNNGYSYTSTKPRSVDVTVR